MISICKIYAPIGMFMNVKQFNFWFFIGRYRDILLKYLELACKFMQIWRIYISEVVFYVDQYVSKYLTTSFVDKVCIAMYRYII